MAQIAPAPIHVAPSQKDEPISDKDALSQKIEPISGKALKKMNTEAIDDFVKTYEAEQRNLMKGTDLNNLERDPNANCNMSLTWKGVSFSVEVPDPEKPKETKKKTILEECNGHIDAGKLVAFMGPSGCGKTTLMDMLAGKKTAKYEGQIFANGKLRDRYFQRLIAYIGQADIMPPHWTVGEAVIFNALLKKPTPSKMTMAHYNLFIDGLLQDMGLIHVKDTKIGGETVRGISGGQRRRVSLARGLVSSAHCMFCDEPTSGLSATDAELCIRVLKIAAKKWGVTVIVVIHQPRIEVARLFDQLVLLTAQPGRIVYNGTMEGAADHFAQVGFPVPTNANPTDFYLDMITPGADGAEPDKFRAFYNEQSKPFVLKAVEDSLKNPGPTPMELLDQERDLMLAFGNVPPVTQTIYGVGFMTQLKLVFRRKMQLTLRDPEVIGATVIMNLFLGVVMGVMFLDVGSTEPKGAAQLAFLFNVLMQVAMGSMNVMPALIAERTIMKLETDEALYSPWAFIWTTFFVMGIISFIGNTVFIVLMWAFGNIGWDDFGIVYVYILLAWFSMDSVFAAVAATAKKIESAQAIAMPPLLIAIMFSGLMINKNSKTPLKFLCNVSPLYWVTEMIAYDAYGDDPQAWLNLRTLYGFEEPNRAVGIGVNLGIALIFRVLQVLALKYLNKIEK